jgi:hypothetical protein
LSAFTRTRHPSGGATSRFRRYVPSVSTPSAALRELLLAAQVLDNVDMEICENGIVLTDAPPVHVRWSSLLAAAGGAPLGSARARARVCAWLTMRRQVAGLPGEVLIEQVRAVGLPVGHVLNPGRGWIQHSLLGDALNLGIGVQGLNAAEPDEVAIVPASIWRAARIDHEALWTRCASHLERMGELAAARWQRDGDALRPMGGCDVVTLLGAASMRAALASSAGGLRPVVAPMRTRGWTSISRLDPAFAPAAAAATPPEQRGFPRPVLVTIDEVVLAADGPNTFLGAEDAVREQNYDRYAGFAATGRR